MNKISILATVGGALTVGALAIAAPAMAQTDGGSAPGPGGSRSGGSTTSAPAASPRRVGAAASLPSDPGAVDADTLNAFTAAIRNGDINSTRPVPGLDDLAPMDLPGPTDITELPPISAADLYAQLQP